MRKYFYLCGVIFLSMNLFAQQRVPNTGEESQYCSWKKNKLTVEYNQIVLSNTIGWRYDQIYSDEFEGNHINTSKWNIPNNTWHSPNSAVGFINSPKALCLNTSDVTNWKEAMSTLITPQSSSHPTNQRRFILTLSLAAVGVLRLLICRQRCGPNKTSFSTKDSRCPWELRSPLE